MAIIGRTYQLKLKGVFDKVKIKWETSNKSVVYIVKRKKYCYVHQGISREFNAQVNNAKSYSIIVFIAIIKEMGYNKII